MVVVPEQLPAQAVVLEEQGEQLEVVVVNSAEVVMLSTWKHSSLLESSDQQLLRRN